MTEPRTDSTYATGGNEASGLTVQDAAPRLRLTGEVLDELARDMPDSGASAFQCDWDEWQEFVLAPVVDLDDFTIKSVTTPEGVVYRAGKSPTFSPGTEYGTATLDASDLTRFIDEALEEWSTRPSPEPSDQVAVYLAGRIMGGARCRLTRYP